MEFVINHRVIQKCHDDSGPKSATPDYRIKESFSRIKDNLQNEI